MTEAKHNNPVFGPSSNVLEALKDATFEKPQHLTKPNGQSINTRIIKEGIGMVGLEDRVENQEWAGIFNHYVKVAGASLKLGTLLKLNGQDVNLQLMVNTVMLSHGGRRQYDEASWYPEKIPDSSEKRQKSDTQIGLENLESKNLSPELIDMIGMHGLGVLIQKSWNEKLPLYLDFRIAQNAIPMEQRFQDLQRGVTAGRYTQEFLDQTQNWARSRESELFEALKLNSYDSIVNNPKNLKARLEVAIQLGKFTKEEIRVLQESKIYKPRSEDTRDIATSIELKHEEFLERLQLRPEDINDKLIQPSIWERYVRRLYISDAEQGIFTRLSQLHTDISEGKTGSREELEKEFPENTWWGKYARELYDKRHGKPLHPKNHKQIGIARAIEFYSQLEKKRKEE